MPGLHARPRRDKSSHTLYRHTEYEGPSDSRHKQYTQSTSCSTARAAALLRCALEARRPDLLRSPGAPTDPRLPPTDPAPPLAATDAATASSGSACKVNTAVLSKELCATRALVRCENVSSPKAIYMIACIVCPGRTPECAGSRPRYL